MGGTIDDATWKNMLAICDSNGDGKVFFSVHNFRFHKMNS